MRSVNAINLCPDDETMQLRDGFLLLAFGRGGDGMVQDTSSVCAVGLCLIGEVGVGGQGRGRGSDTKSIVRCRGLF
jgi:hypothetical protein